MINVIAVFPSVMPGSALLSLQQELRRGFEALKAAKDTFDGGHAECQELVSSLGNLALQLKALKQVQISETPLSGFPCLQQRLHYKLSLAVDALLAKLAEKMAALQKVRDAFAQQVFTVVQLYEKNTDALDISVCVSRSAVSPSVSDMLEWLQDADRYYRLQLMQSRLLLQTLTPTDLTSMETAPNRWRSLRSARQEERIADALCQVSIFLETE